MCRLSEKNVTSALRAASGTPVKGNAQRPLRRAGGRARSPPPRTPPHGSVPVRLKEADESPLAAARGVDEQRGIEQQADHLPSARPAGVGATLPPRPRCRVVVPIVASIGQAAERSFDVVPAAVVIETPLDQLADERTSSSRACAPIDFRHEVVVERYAQTHGLQNTMDGTCSSSPSPDPRSTGGPGRRHARPPFRCSGWSQGRFHKSGDAQREVEAGRQRLRPRSGLTPRSSSSSDARVLDSPSFTPAPTSRRV